MASAVAKRDDSNVPDLVRTPATEITADDIKLPRIYIGQYMSRAVQDQLVKPGVIFAAIGADDPDPNVLWDPKSSEEGVKFYVLALRKGKSWTAGPGEELQLFDFDDPAAPPDAWVTYGYTVAVPSVDDTVPFKLLLTRTGRSAAQQINTVLMKNQISGPSYESAFLMTTAPRENAKGKFFVPRIAIGEADAKEVEVASRIAVTISANVTSQRSTGDLPAI